MEQNPSIDIEKELLSIVRGFLSEFKTERALNNLSLNASLEKDLGIDSLGKVELFLRIEKAFSVQFEDTLMIEADSLQDIVSAIQNAHPAQQTFTREFASTLAETHLDPLSIKTLTEILIRRAAEDPNRPHIYLQDEHGVEEIIRYGQLLDSARKVAAGLCGEGLNKGETVAIMLPTSQQFFYAFFGVLLAGGIPVPIYPPLRADRIEEYSVREASILNNAGVRILITFDKTEALAKLLRVFIKSLHKVTTVDYLINSSKVHLPKIVIHANDPALIQYTSGSTSAPKGVLLSHANLLANLRTFGEAAHFTPKEVGVSWLPLYHDMGLIGAWLGSLYHAFPLTVLSPLSFLNRPERWLWAIHYHRGTISGGPNFAYELCVRKIDEAAIQGLDLSSWRLAFNGAEAVNPKTLERFTKKFAPFGFKAESFYPVYGLAESCVALTFPPVNRKPKLDLILREPFEKEQEAIPATNQDPNTLEFVSCGMPLPEHVIRIVNEEGQELGERKVGSLHFNGPSAMQGYYHNSEATEAIYHDGWWDSGDYAYIAGKEVFITGRKKDMIIKAGRNLYPQEIEEITAQVSDVRKGCVIAFGVNDPKWGTEKLVIVAETALTKKNDRSQMIVDIIEKVSVVLGLPPDEVVLVPPRTLPKTSSGKLQRSLCKQNYQEGKLNRRALPVSLQMAKLLVKGFFLKVGSQINKVFRFFYTLYLGLLLIILIPFIWIAILLLPRQLAARVCRSGARIFILFSFGLIEAQGKENLTKTHPLIYIANHASYIDSLLLLSLLPIDVAFVGKQEIKTWPIIGKSFKKLEYLTVDRLDFSKSLEDSEKIIETLKMGRSIVLFPEGTFSHSPGLRPFKLGAFKMAVESEIPICPIAIKGSRVLFRTDHFLQTLSKVSLSIGEPLLPQNKEWSEVIRLHSDARAYIAKYCGEPSIDLVASTPLDPKHPNFSES